MAALAPRPSLKAGAARPLRFFAIRALVGLPPLRDQGGRLASSAGSNSHFSRPPFRGMRRATGISPAAVQRSASFSTQPSRPATSRNSTRLFSQVLRRWTSSRRLFRAAVSARAPRGGGGPRWRRPIPGRDGVARHAGRRRRRPRAPARHAGRRKGPAAAPLASWMLGRRSRPAPPRVCGPGRGSGGRAPLERGEQGGVLGLQHRRSWRRRLPPRRGGPDAAGLGWRGRSSREPRRGGGLDQRDADRGGIGRHAAFDPADQRGQLARLDLEAGGEDRRLGRGDGGLRMASAPGIRQVDGGYHRVGQIGNSAPGRGVAPRNGPDGLPDASRRPFMGPFGVVGAQHTPRPALQLI